MEEVRRALCLAISKALLVSRDCMTTKRAGEKFMLSGDVQLQKIQCSQRTYSTDFNLELLNHKIWYQNSRTKLRTKSGSKISMLKAMLPNLTLDIGSKIRYSKSFVNTLMLHPRGPNTAL